MSGRGRKKSAALCGYTTVILFSEEQFLNLRNLRFYNVELMLAIPWMQVTEDYFERSKKTSKELFRL